MASHQRYSLSAFRKLGRSSFRREYAIVDNENLYTFEWKSYYDEDGDLLRVKMLRVGGYHYRGGGPPAWVYVNGSSIQYFSGRETVVGIIRKELESKVYFTKPLLYFAGPQRANGMTLGRICGKTSTEAVILFLFLKFGAIKTVYAGAELLRHFEVACLNYEGNRRVYEKEQAWKLFQEYDLDDEVKGEYSSDDDMSSWSIASAQDAAEHQQAPQASLSISTAIAIEERVRTELSGEKMQLENEIEALKRDLQEQKYKASNANTAFNVERRRRKTVEKDAKAAREGLVQQQELAGEWRERAEEFEQQAMLSQAEWEQSQTALAQWQTKSADYQAKSRQWQKAAKDCQTKLSKSQAESQDWSSQYKSLKRKLKGLTEDDAEPVKKTSKR